MLCRHQPFQPGELVLNAFAHQSYRKITLTRLTLFALLSNVFAFIRRFRLGFKQLFEFAFIKTVKLKLRLFAAGTEFLRFQQTVEFF